MGIALFLSTRYVEHLLFQASATLVASYKKFLIKILAPISVFEMTDLLVNPYWNCQKRRRLAFVNRLYIPVKPQVAKLIITPSSTSNKIFKAAVKGWVRRLDSGQYTLNTRRGVRGSSANNKEEKSIKIPDFIFAITKRSDKVYQI